MQQTTSKILWIGSPPFDTGETLLQIEHAPDMPSALEKLSSHSFDGCILHASLSTEEVTHLFHTAMGRHPDLSVIIIEEASATRKRDGNSEGEVLYLTPQQVTPTLIEKMIPVLRRIREQERLIHTQQSKLMKNAKMAALGEMATSIVHEINNPLAVVFGNTELLTKYVNAGKWDAEKFKTLLGKIKDTADRITQIVKSLRSYGRTSDNDPYLPTMAEKIIQSSIEICKGRYNSVGVELTVTDDSRQAQILCREGEIVQILVNLLNNALDAVEHTKEKKVEIRSYVENRYVCISVTDNGSGIAPEIKEKIMSPFFTTKPVGKGTGLGLSISRRIARAHKGELELSSENSQTTFNLRIPLAE